MLNIFKGNLIFKKENSLLIENDFNLKEIIVLDVKNFIINEFYKFYIYEHHILINKTNKEVYYYGFNNLNDLINFEKLLKIDGIGFKTAQKIILNGIEKLKQLVEENNINLIITEFGLSTKIASNIFDYFKVSNNKKHSSNDIKKINMAISNLEKLGYAKQISTKVVWKRKDEIINNNFSKIFYLLIEDIKNERLNSKA